MKAGDLVQMTVGWSPIGLILEIREPELGDRDRDGFLPLRDVAVAVVEWADGNRSTEHKAGVKVINESR
jgi:hypothetical protein